MSAARVQAHPRTRTAEWRRVVLLLAIALAGAVCTGWLHPKAPPADFRSSPEITWEMASSLPAARVLWVDARTRDAYDRGHIPGAILVNEDEWQGTLTAFIQAWQPGQHVIVYCSSTRCHASKAVAKRLVRELSIEPVSILHGGWEAWTARKP